MAHRHCRACLSTASSSRQRLRTFASSGAIAAQPEPATRRPRKPLQPLCLSQHFSPTQKASQSSPSEAHDDALPSLQLLLRGGYIRSSSSGVFTLLPNALRIIRKISTIIDHELAAISATRLALPSLLPSKLWHHTRRYAAMGSELYKLRDRRDAEFVLGPTHEEEITKLVAHEVDSHRQLPVRVYQITTKFRDEPRPRMGLLRTKEFLMKDLYSFDKTAADAMATYDEVRGAYARIFDRVFGGRDRWAAAEADTGAIGGNKSHEYHVRDAAGEDTLISCAQCGYAANTEKAVSMPDPAHMPVSASDVRVLLFGCADVQVHDQVMHAFVLPSSRGLNDTKLEKLVAKLRTTTNAPRQPTTTDATDTIELLYDSAASAAAPQASWDWKERAEGPLVRFTSLSVLADFECASLDPAELNDALLTAVNTFASRTPTATASYLALIDLFPAQFGHFAATPLAVTPPLTLVDVRTAHAHDTCAACKCAALAETRAIEVGHTFFLGERYSRALEAGFVPSSEVKDTYKGGRMRNGRVPFQMGCYGIGVSRILGALAQKATEDFARAFGGRRAGFVWPRHVAPYTAVVIVSDAKDSAKLRAAHDVWRRIVQSARTTDASVRAVLESIVAQHTPHTALMQAEEDDGWTADEASELVIDDRAATLGSKLADSDLTGYAFRVLVGKHFSARGKVELQYCAGGDGWHAVLLPVEAFGEASV
ncbi:related to prolyl-tRNA synthetase [Sporisorium reilianum f. sp. reilianum]|uniref:proline--tRNA ligase n=1 Tax=Sporisorium reilianum f. sp. reilianum TaxID=72559 RepID=A0A2N8UNZ8_9BASI|nr:related to prolyl-tRNA synthetase [Sporisorium reilianum f. sp. reilianum]